MNTDTPVVTRIAPSPTGLLHIGTARAALFNYLYARKHSGRFVLRIEDTDRERSMPEYEKNILAGLEWLGLSYDEMVRQSERTPLYVEKLDALIASDKAYVSKEPAKNDPDREVEVVRLRNPGKSVTFQDAVRGEITFDTTELGDFVIARSRTEPLYHLAVVVDDADMGITHVIRGEDHISNTPRQILIQEALDLPRPQYAHMPLILAPDRSKMSKRKGAVAVTSYRDQGFLPSAVINYLALLGWNPGTDKELYVLEELVEDFSLEQIQKGGAVFDIEKLKWLNREHRKAQPREEVLAQFMGALGEYPWLQQVLQQSERAADDVLERFTTPGELAAAVAEGLFSYYETAPTVTSEGLCFKKDPYPDKVPERLAKVTSYLERIDATTFNAETVKSAVWVYAEDEGKGGVLWPMRYALSGMDRSPDPFLLAEALGKDETLARLKTAQEAFV
jgi:glutamyl-tRNA synthetase